MINGNQFRAARALVRLRQDELAFGSGVTVQTIGRIEAVGAEQVPGSASILEALVAALAERGVAIAPCGVMLAPANALGSPLVSLSRGSANGYGGRDAAKQSRQARDV